MNKFVTITIVAFMIGIIAGFFIAIKIIPPEVITIKEIPPTILQGIIK